MISTGESASAGLADIKRPASTQEDYFQFMEHADSQFKVRTRRCGGLNIMLGTSGPKCSKIDVAAFRAAPHTVGILISDGPLSLLEEDFKHICSQSGRSLSSQLQSWITHRLDEAGGESFVMALTWNRRSGRVHWHCGGLDAEPVTPAGWRALAHRLGALQFWRIGTRTDSGRWQLHQDRPWMLTARPRNAPETLLWLRIESL